MHEIARQVGGLAGLDAGQLPEQLGEDGPQLRPGHVRAEAEVQPAAAEADVRVGVTAQVQPFGMVERPVSQLPDG